ncbi:MAG: FAD-binding oxidoreductase [Candidatus Omnitrophica bacterium]|nr:FAD-binding oxidoreductase [Candidatus Omnitrophota bacterium]
MAESVKILMTEQVTHNVKRFIVEKPGGFSFTPGQGTLVAINTPELKTEAHPFTPTSLNDDKVIEFIIKQYHDRRGLTEKLHRLQSGDELIIQDVFGDIKYKGAGTFIAGGTGITPFIAILRQVRKENRLKGNTLFFSNKTWKDIILERELEVYLGANCIFTLTEEKKTGYENGSINESFLKKNVKDVSQYFYVCGPAKFIEDINVALVKLGVKKEKLIFDQP